MINGANQSSQPLVLIADDAKEAREALGALLARSGYRVETAADGTQAIELLKSSRVEALILDLHMPGEDGFAVLAYIREHRRGLPCILLSGLPPNEIQSQMIRTGTEELPPLFQKPADYDMLLDVLGMLLSGELPPRVE